MWCMRRWRKKLLISCVSALAFSSLWMFLTLVLLIAQEQWVASNKNLGTSKDDDVGKGVQVVVGHYNGNLPDLELKGRKNLSKETVNENDFQPIAGYGENGKAVRLNGQDELLAKDLFQINQFNLVASDRIPLNRTLSDARKKACRSKQYDVTALPDTSVVIVFHNEAFSTLARTVTSVINRSPGSLLKEIILVDDASERDFLKEPLDIFASSQVVKTLIVRSPERIGLIRARLMGAAKATGKVLTFLDSHCECTTGWLEPLLDRISADRTVSVCPIIDVINDQTFAYSKGIELFRGGFNWNLQFRWYSVPPREIKRRGQDPIAPIESPTMAGGLFAINRDYFYEIGSYDDQMDIWGGENLEMSFRIWQCGGKIEILPCSHVGHVFRKASPHDFPGKKSNIVLNTNLARLAEVWMDDWKNVFYNTAPQAKEIVKKINVTARLTLRNKLGCKSFKWYLDNVWPEHFFPMTDQFFGRIKNLGSNVCMQLTYVRSPTSQGNVEKRISLETCIDNYDRSQLWIYSNRKYIRGDEHQCLTATKVSSVWIVELKECTETDKDIWDYKEHNKNLVHRSSGLCLGKPLTTGAPDEVHLPSLSKCNRDDEAQEWVMHGVDWLSKK